jgi:hypothetical protein
VRYFTAALAALLIAAPAAAVAGPDALSIAKRALRLAKEPPRVEYVPGLPKGDTEGIRYTATCPRGMLPVGEFHDFEGTVWVQPDDRAVKGFWRNPPPLGTSNATLTAVCAEARLQRTVAR